ncbi:hypothetical protein HK099_004207 [Clydaea vesicula]|uniref:Uncharacterized protein n=1 Tax=Clydaea vesicula TaxID=447962 RepID=A0AAD5XVR7_9FUNG|nr:hypothetical protein HK099_004207 [Clydaea vesicula]
MSNSAKSRQERLMELERERALYQQQQNLASSSLSLQVNTGSFQNLLHSESESVISEPCFANQNDFISKFKTGGSKTHKFNVTKENSTTEKKDEKPRKLVSGSTTPKSIRKVGNGLQNDPWSRMVQSNEKSRAKYHGSEKTLIVMVEEERIKYIQLESEYQNLLTQIQLLTKTHHQELTLLKEEFEYKDQNLKKKLSKNELDFSNLIKDMEKRENKLKIDIKFKEDSFLNLEKHLLKLKCILNESEEDNSKKENTVKLIEKEKKNLTLELENYKEEFQKINFKFKEKEKEAMEQQDLQFKLKFKFSNLEQQLFQSQEECKSLKLLLQKSKLDVEDLEKFKKILLETRKELEVYRDREHKILSENKNFSKNEAKILLELEEAQIKNRKIQVDFEVTKENLEKAWKDNKELIKNESGLLQHIEENEKTVKSIKGEIESLKNLNYTKENDILKLKSTLEKVLSDFNEEKNCNTNLKFEIENLKENNSKKIQELEKYTVKQESLLKENLELSLQKEKNLEEIQKLKQEKELLKVDYEKDVLRFKQEEDKLRQEKEDILLSKGQLEQQIRNKEKELQFSEKQFNDVGKRLELELKQKLDTKKESFMKISLLQENISNITNELNSTQEELFNLKEFEKGLKANVQKKDETLQKIQNLFGQLEEENVNLKEEFENFKFEKQHEFENLKKLNFENNMKLKNLIKLKSVEAEEFIKKEEENMNLIEDFKKENVKLKNEVEDTKMLNTKLRTFLKENNLKHEKEFEVLNDNFLKSEKNLKFFEVKNKSLVEELKRLELELENFRNEKEKKNFEVSKLKSNVESLNRKLRSQVDLLLNDDYANDNAHDERSVIKNKNEEYLARPSSNHQKQEQEMRYTTSSQNSPFQQQNVKNKERDFYSQTQQNTMHNRESSLSKNYEERMQKSNTQEFKLFGGLNEFLDNDAFNYKNRNSTKLQNYNEKYESEENPNNFNRN